MLEWLVRLLNLSFEMGVLPLDWCGACIVPLCKGKGDKCECSNSKCISLLNVVGKLKNGSVIKRVKNGTVCAKGRRNVGFGRVVDASTKCLPLGGFVKSLKQMGKMNSGRLWIWKRPIILSIAMVCGRW